MSQKLLTNEEAKKINTNELYQRLSANENGLSISEVEKRLNEYGYNEITEKRVNPIIKFLSNFWGPIPWMIEVAVILSAIIAHWEDFWIILALLFLNAFVRFWEEHKADNAIALLKQNLALKAKVKRDGKWTTLDAKEIVPGDIVRVRLGDIIPADIKLTNGEYLLVDQSTLTGESLPVEKKISDIGYSGAIVKQGEMNGLVITTGMNTYFGQTTKLVEEAKNRSHFQKAVMKIGNFLMVFAAVLISIIFIVSILRNVNVFDTIEFALVLTVASIPVALPAVLSVTMAIGAVALTKKGAIVSKLVSIEELAGVDVLCLDKTGTITKNELKVGDIISFDGFNEKEILIFGTLASREEDQDAIDNAIIDKTKTIEGVMQTIDSYKILDFTPFDPIIKRTEVGLKDKDGKIFKVAKGAPQVILSISSNKQSLSEKVNEYVENFAEKGYRALGVAKTDDNQEVWKFIGLIALFDPPREDSAETIRTAIAMGLNVKMVTGDHVSIAKEIAKTVNLGTNIIPVSSFINKSDEEAKKLVEEADGFAQVFPEHKYHIVELLQESGHIVGMTGDGVNDAPALKKADVGIAVSNATDAAKSAADITLTKPGLSVIIDGIIESRKIFQRMLTYSTYRIAETIRIIIFITFAIIIFQFYPITALMIVLLAILNDAAIMTIAYDNVEYSNSPERWDMRRILIMASVLGVIGVFSSFGLLFIGLQVFHVNQTTLQTLIYLKLSVAGHLTVFVVRTKGHFWTKRPSRILFIAVVLTQIIATLITVYGILLPAMGWTLALFVWIYAIIAFLITDFIKVFVNKILDKRSVN